MVDTSGSGGVLREFYFDSEFTEKISHYAEPEHIDKFIRRVERGIEFYSNFTRWNLKSPDGQTLRNQVIEYRDHLKTTIELFDRLHLDAFSLIEQHYLLKFKEYSWIFSARRNDFNSGLMLELRKQIIACDDLLPELEVRTGRPGFSTELHIVKGVLEALNKYGKNRPYRLSSSETSTLVQLLDTVLYELSLNENIGKTGYVGETKYYCELAKSMARSQKKHVERVKESFSDKTP